MPPRGATRVTTGPQEAAMEAAERTVPSSPSPSRGRSVSPRATSSLSTALCLRPRHASALSLLVAGALAALAVSQTLRLRVEAPRYPPRGPVLFGAYERGARAAAAAPPPAPAGNNATGMPGWMRDYFVWHTKTRRALTPRNYRDGTAARFLVLRCLREDPKCGGAADRLKGLPFVLLVAHQTRRLLLIDWTRPHRLEEFLVPPSHTARKGDDGLALDWTVPPWMTVPHAPREVLIDTRQVLGQLLNESHPTSQQPFVDLRHQSHDYGMGYYDEHAGRRGEPSFLQVYPAVWRAVFAPAPAVRRNLRRHPLYAQPEPYVSLHIRTLYARNASAHAKMIRHAVHCAYQLAANHSLAYRPLLVATDSLASTRNAGAYAALFFRRVYGRTDPAHEPLHLDRGRDFLDRRRQQQQQGITEDNDNISYWDAHPPAAFRAVFEDLYLLAGGACHAYGLGGFGRWGAELSAHPDCAVNHAVRGLSCPAPPVAPARGVVVSTA